MDSEEPLSKGERLQLIEELHQRYTKNGNVYTRFCLLRKKYIWLIVVQGTRAFKRLVDVLVSLTILIGLFPVFLLIALLIKATDRGPVFYISTRVGKWGAEFNFPKFRSMKVNAHSLKNTLIQKNIHTDGATFKIKKDPRITWVGRILRRTSLDELPQLWNVLKGEMTLVGPRPPLPEEVALYSIEDRRRLDVRPGLTCYWQIRGRSNIPFDQQVAMDREYIESRSLYTDLKILIKTIPAVLLGKGAY